MRSVARILLALLATGLAAAMTISAVLIGGFYYVEPSLPHAEELRNVRFQIPLRVYTRDGRLIQQFGSQRRTPVEYEQIPDVLINALIAAEDDRFFEHPGLDFLVTVRQAFYYLAAGGERVAGGSTITQQVAREYFLSRDVSLVRKFKEWILALRIEREFSKEEILELFFNTFFFGQHSYGVAAAAQTYFGKELAELSLSDAAILAGIPQGPSIMNPIYSVDNAKMRRAYVLRRMRELSYISQREHDEALEVPVRAERHGLKMELDAPYVAEMVRADMVRRFGDAAYTAGFKVTTTLDSRLQVAADKALRDTVVAYDRRHGYRGPVARLELPEDLAVQDDADLGDIDVERLHELLADYPRLVGLETGIVLRSGDDEALVFLPSLGLKTIGLETVAWAAPYVNDDAVGRRPQTVAEALSPGDIVRFTETEDAGLRLAQLPDVQGGFVALDPVDGAIVALSGGFDFYLNSFNRATQARRQPGSAFKPFVYSAALENGFTTARIVDDAPVTINDPVLESVWRPENYTNRFYGQIRFREALVLSLNAATVRIILEAGVPQTVNHLRRFGFDEAALPRNAALALGAGNMSALALTAGYAVFANGGFRVTPYFIDRIEDASGDLLYQAKPALACAECEEPTNDRFKERPALIEDLTELYLPLRLAPRAISAQNAYLTADMLQSVVRPPGTGVAARRELGRDDIGGKTGTTNDNRDAWFAGFNSDIVAAAWIGFDQDRPLGSREQGGVTAIPMWTAFMREALDGVPERPLKEPPGIVEVRINPRNGLVASSATTNSVFEKFRIGHVPERELEPVFSSPGSPSSPAESARPPGLF
jgi:penicillin-binding protein 1A